MIPTACPETPVTKNQRSVTSQKSEDFIYTVDTKQINKYFFLSPNVRLCSQSLKTVGEKNMKATRFFFFPKPKSLKHFSRKKGLAF
jgi:hypothetical protein